MATSKSKTSGEFNSDLMTKKGTHSVRIKQALYDEAKKLCDETGVSVNDYVNAAMAQKLVKDLDL
jgi:hypothetical protein